MWQQLIHTALLGTDKAEFDESLLPESIFEIVSKMPESDKESRLFKIISLLTFYQDAGQMLKRLEYQQVSHPQPPTPSKIASVQFTAILGEVLAVPYLFRNDLIDYWISRLIDKHETCMPSAIVELTAILGSLPKKLQIKVYHVIGERGRKWLNLKNTTVLKEVARSEKEIWTEGKLAERRELFVNYRKENPSASLALLQSTWNEESLVDKKAFVEVIKKTFQNTDIPFLENILPEFAYKLKERKTQKEVRTLIMGLMLRGGNPIFQQTTDLLKKYFFEEKVKGILGLIGKRNNVFLLPVAEDDFWNINVMETQFGLDNPSDDFILSTKQYYWLSFFIEYLPFHFWMENLEKDIDATVKYFLSQDFCIKQYGTQKELYIKPLIENALQFQDIALARAIIKQTSLDKHSILLGILPMTEREEYLVEKKQLDSIVALEACFGTWDGTWTLEFSNKILKNTYTAIMERNILISEHIALILSRHLDPSSIVFLKNLQESSNQTYYINYWDKHFAKPIMSIIEIKQKCRAIA